MTTITPLVKDILQRAYAPKSVFPQVSWRIAPSVHRSQIPDELQGQPSVYWELVEQAILASRIRAQAQEQLARAMSALADPDHFNWSRLFDESNTTMPLKPRKPRVRLWAQINQRDTLEVFWLPEIDETAEIHMRLTSYTVCNHSDYSNVPSTWPSYGVSSNVLLRFVADEYLLDVNPRGAKRCLDGRRLIKDALTESLTTLLQAISATCDVKVDVWPVYNNEERLVLVSAADRAQTMLQQKVAELTNCRDIARSSLAGALTSVGLTSTAEFNAMVKRAAEDGVKLTRLIFDKTGKRCSSLKTDKIPSLMAEWKAQEKALKEAQVALDQGVGAFFR